MTPGLGWGRRPVSARTRSAHPREVLDRRRAPERRQLLARGAVAQLRLVPEREERLVAAGLGACAARRRAPRPASGRRARRAAEVRERAVVADVAAELRQRDEDLRRVRDHTSGARCPEACASVSRSSSGVDRSRAASIKRALRRVRGFLGETASGHRAVDVEREPGLVDESGLEAGRARASAMVVSPHRARRSAAEAVQLRERECVHAAVAAQTASASGSGGQRRARRAIRPSTSGQSAMTTSAPVRGPTIGECERSRRRRGPSPASRAGLDASRARPGSGVTSSVRSMRTCLRARRRAPCRASRRRAPRARPRRAAARAASSRRRGP